MCVCRRHGNSLQWHCIDYTTRRSKPTKRGRKCSSSVEKGTGPSLS
uniref:CSON014350 protein n=1 Tax=Culicoides sonorensis TaxID=179676 RepID=A0A336MAG8_CULSO